MEEHRAPPDVFAESIHNGVKLSNRYWLVILDGHMKVSHIGALVLNGYLGQRHDGRDAMGVASREFLSISETANVEAFPNLGP